MNRAETFDAEQVREHPVSFRHEAFIYAPPAGTIVSTIREIIRTDALTASEIRAKLPEGRRGAMYEALKYLIKTGQAFTVGTRGRFRYRLKQ